MLRTRGALLLALSGVALAGAVDLFFVLVPAISTAGCRASPNSVISCSSTKSTLLEEYGTRALALLAFPTALALFVLLFALPAVRLPRFFSWIAVIVLCGFCLLAGFSIGLFYVPAALLGLLSVLRTQAERPVL
jgi:hypothetical protein